MLVCTKQSRLIKNPKILSEGKKKYVEPSSLINKILLISISDYMVAASVQNNLQYYANLQTLVFKHFN